jgi:hypothetical protein
MSTIIMRFRIPKVGGPDDEQTSSMELLRKGTLLDPNGIPILASLDFNRISPDDVQHLLVNKESDGSSRV